MDWPNERVLKFIKLYEKHPCIWDLTHKSHKNRGKVNDAWYDIKSCMDVPCSVPELKKKKESLMAAYRSIKIKMRRPSSSGEVHKPIWFAFQALDSFLGPFYNGSSFSTEAESSDHNTEDSKSVDSADGPDDPLYEFTPSDNANYYEMTPAKPGSIGRKRSHSALESPHMEEQVEKKIAKEDYDECELFGRLVTKKLRRMPEDRRDLLIYKINQLMFNTNVVDQQSDFMITCSSGMKPIKHENKD